MVHTCEVVSQERDKYRSLWTQVPKYRENCIGEQLIGAFLSLCQAQPGDLILDVGCGTGRASAKFVELMFQVVAMDFVEECLDPQVAALAADPRSKLTFCEQVLWKTWPHFRRDSFVFCSDVLEHIPTEFTMLVIERCLCASQRAFFHINFDPDFYGQAIGEILHVTTQSFEWWRDRIAQLGHIVDARDMLGHGLFVVEPRGVR